MILSNGSAFSLPLAKGRSFLRTDGASEEEEEGRSGLK